MLAGLTRLVVGAGRSLSVCGVRGAPRAARDRDIVFEAARTVRPRLALALIPLLLLAGLLAGPPYAFLGAPATPVEVVSAAVDAPVEVVSDAPVCVRFYPATGETREGPEICTTQPGGPPPVGSSSRPPASPGR